MQDRLESHILSSYFAPRGHNRMYILGRQLAQIYLSPFDKLIGIIGDAGAGKSALIRGMFPGLELTNDDDGVYVRPLPLLDVGSGSRFFSHHTYHVDIRFENGFTQMSVLAEAIDEALRLGKRVIVEHFELIYPLLGYNANLLIGAGEQILITRPNLFGPEPDEIKKVVYDSLPYRLMAHTAEDLCEHCMPDEDYNRCGHSDIKHGFIITFPGKEPSFSIAELEAKVNDMIKQNLTVAYHDPEHVCIGDIVHPCTGPRIHVSSTGLIKDFHLLNQFIYDRMTDSYLLVGYVGHDPSFLNELPVLKSKQYDKML